MRPLASPAAEYRLLGIGGVLSGIAFALVALVVDGALAAAVGLLVTGALFGTLMYVLAWGPFARRAVEQPAPAPTANREPAARTRRRVALTTGLLLVLLAAVAVLFDNPALVGGIAVGNGAALLRTSRWLRTWEHERHGRLLREPRWRWSRKGRGGWARGRGMMDPQDFYVEPGTRDAPETSHVPDG